MTDNLAIKRKVRKCICTCISNGDVDELRYHAIKYKVDLKISVIDDKKRTALHLAVKYRRTRIVSYLISINADFLAKDYKGNVPVLIAVKDVMKRKSCPKKVFKKILKPLFDASPESLKEKNVQGLSAAELLHDFNFESGSPKRKPEPESRESYWEEKIRMEAENDYFQEWGQYEEDFYYKEPEEETLDWADRIREEYKAKKRQERYAQYRHKRKQQEPRPESKPHLKLNEENMKYWKEREKLQLIGRKNKYERTCRQLFEVDSQKMITIEDLPLKEKLIETLVGGLEANTSEKKIYLKKQQVRWHPDKFIQKCGHRISESTREEILDRVKHISQLLNSHLETL